MDAHEIRWDFYPRTAAYPATRSFVERLVLKGKRPKTVDAYARVIEDLLTYFDQEDISCMLEADEADLDRYIAHLKQRGPKKRGQGRSNDESHSRSLTGRKLSDNTIGQRIVVCRLFYDFLIRQHLRSDPLNPIERGRNGRDGQRPVRGPWKKQELMPWLPSDVAWEQFLSHVLQQEDPRTQAMILLAYDGALRREELISLRVDDIDWTRGIITIRSDTTKSGRTRYVPVSAGVLHLVRHYIKGDRHTLIAAYDGEEAGPIFLSESTRNPACPLAAGAFDEIMERVREKVGLPTMTPHTLRHQRCTMLRRAGVDLDDIALVAGHTSTKTTRLYIHLTPTDLSKRIRTKVEPVDAPIQALIEQVLGKEDHR